MRSVQRANAGSRPQTAALQRVLVVATVAWMAVAVFKPGAEGVFGVIRAGIGLVLTCSASMLLIDRVRRTVIEREMWRPVMLAGLALSIGYLTQTVLAEPLTTVAHVDDQWRGLPFALAVPIACGLLYRGLVQWNRFRTAVADPADWLNGLSAVLAMAGVGSLVIRLTGAPGRWPAWEQQTWLVALAAAVVLLGALGTVASLAELGRDSRVWLLTGAVTLGIGGLIAAPWTSEPPFSQRSSAQAAWLVALALTAYASSRTPKPVQSQPSTTSSVTTGTLVVLLSSVIVLAICAESGLRNEGAALYALLAFTGASTQAARIVRQLTHLAQSRFEARTDDLTGVANRRELMQRLEAAVTQQTDTTLLLIDLDRFKNVNDRYGHATGDELLRRVAEKLQQSAPADALLARIGGDEFAVLLRNTATEDVDAIVKRFVDTIAGISEVDDRTVNVGVSVGVAFGGPSPISTEGIDAGELLRRADVAMYLAKRTQADVGVYDESLERDARQRSEHAQALRSLLTDTGSSSHLGQLVAYYQPQIGAATGETAGFEALVRWQHPELGLIPPDAFLPVVEEEGLMTRLTGHVLGQAVTEAVRWQAAGPVRVAVNVSASSLADPELLEIIHDTLQQTGFPSHLLTIEITETAFMTSPDQALEAVRRISAMGVGISIDDYGTGYSSLTYLNDLEATELKLDRMLTQKLVTSTRTAAIVGATINLAHHLGLRVVAEGVEDTPTHDALRAMGCDELQGFLFGTPQPPELLVEVLHRHGSTASAIPRSRDRSAASKSRS